MVRTRIIYQLQYVLPSFTQMKFTISELKPYPSVNNPKQAKELVLKNVLKVQTTIHSSSESW